MSSYGEGLVAESQQHTKPVSIHDADVLQVENDVSGVTRCLHGAFQSFCFTIYNLPFEAKNFNGVQSFDVYLQHDAPQVACLAIRCV
jgi:hypothetical protein